MQSDYILNEEQTEVLTELVNVAYGSATAVVAELLDAFATLDIPRVKLLEINEFETYLKGILIKSGESFFSTQGLSGKFSGETIFILSRGSVLKLAKYFDLEEDATEDDLKEVALELTNILSSSTIGKLVSEMDTQVVYSAPSVEILDQFSLTNHKEIATYSHVIVIDTLLAFKEEKIEGELLILTKDDSIEWLKEVLDKIIDELLA